MVPTLPEGAERASRKGIGAPDRQRHRQVIARAFRWREMLENTCVCRKPRPFDPMKESRTVQFPIRKGHVEARRLQPPSNSTLGVRNEHESVLFGKGGFAL
jgi:hypothetical protein